jgi:hypothetical protein
MEVAGDGNSPPPEIMAHVLFKAKGGPYAYVKVGDALTGKYLSGQLVHPNETVLSTVHGKPYLQIEVNIPIIYTGVLMLTGCVVARL